MQQPSDSELVIRAKAGDHNAFTQLYERYAPAIYRYIYFRVGERELAEDLLSDVFVRVVEGLHRYEDRGWPITTWLYRIAHNRVVDARRRQKGRQLVPLEQCDGMCEGPEQSLDHRFDLDLLRSMLGSLTREQREVILMRFIRGLSIEEIAQALGRTAGSVKALQHRGVNALTQEMESYIAEEIVSDLCLATAA